MNLYQQAVRSLDADILDVIGNWNGSPAELREERFNELALRVFAFQLHYNQPYARYCASLGVTPKHMPQSWEAIPAVPAAAFKEAALCTFDPADSALAFETSGTTQRRGGRHYVENAALYDASLLAGFRAFALPGGERLHYVNLVPNPREQPSSSLGYMMATAGERFGDGAAAWYLRHGELAFDDLLSDLRTAAGKRAAVFIATTAFALVHVLDEMEKRGVALALPPGSRVMETGGFKGRSRVVERAALYARASRALGIAPSAIFAEYGMTELLSQYYDSPQTRETNVRVKTGPPWLRARVVGPNGKRLPKGTVGALAHVDLANRSSCLAVATEDLGIEVESGFVLIGRERGAELRGCSLGAEDLQLVRA